MVFRVSNNRVSNKLKVFLCVLLMAIALSGTEAQSSTKGSSEIDASFMGNLLQGLEGII
jgi:hypothetical protein